MSRYLVLSHSSYYSIIIMPHNHVHDIDSTIYSVIYSSSSTTLYMYISAGGRNLKVARRKM